VSYGVHHCLHTVVEISESVMNLSAEMRALAISRSMDSLGDSPAFLFEVLFAELTSKYTGIGRTFR
jgi:hypothetical protein